MAQTFGAVQRLILNQVAEAPAGPGGVLDLRRRQSTHMPASISRAVHRLVERGMLESMVQTSYGFRPDDGWQGPQIRYVRRANGL
jgi:hypothetical protein